MAELLGPGGRTWTGADFGNAVNKIRRVRSAEGVTGYAVGVDVNRLRRPNESRIAETPMRVHALLIALAVAGGCAPVTFRHVRLDPAPQSSPEGTIAAVGSEEDLAAAIAIVEEVARQHGLVRGRESETGATARMYGTPAGSGQILHVYVSARRGPIGIDVTITDFERHDPSPLGRRLRDAIHERFVARFGPARVD